MADTLLIGVVVFPFYACLGVGAVQLARVSRQTDFDDRVSRWLWVVRVLDSDGCVKELPLSHVIVAWSGIFIGCKKLKKLRAYLVTVSADFAFDLSTAQTVSRILLKTVTVKVYLVPESMVTPRIQR